MSRRPVPIEEMVAVYKKNHKNSHLFKIDKFSSLIEYEIERIESSVFVVSGLKWKIIVTFDKDKDYVSIFLENQAAIHNELKYQVYVVSQLKPEWHPMKNVKWDFGTSLKKKQKGFINLMSLDDLKNKGYLIDDCCMFGATLPDLEPARPGTAECFSLIEEPFPNKHTWIIPNFYCLDPETAHKSKEFVVGNRKWRIEVHPGGYEEAKDESFSVYLVGDGFINNAPKTKTFVKYKLRVLDPYYGIHVEQTDSDWVDEEYDDSNGFDDFISLWTLGRYLWNLMLAVEVEFEVISETKYC